MTGEPPDQAAILQALDILHHRGPDDSGCFQDGPLMMGAMRLSIIDIQGGHQPLSNEDESVWLVYNGEIYNHPELRRTLIEQGHRFRSRCDTEVLVHLYEEDPDGFLDRLNGMFALALWDRKRQRLILARDRIGMKPLFVSRWNGSLYFASEMKAILCMPSFPGEWDYRALDNYFSFYYVTAPQTIYKHIRRVMPGECLVWEAGKTTSRRYWNYSYSEGDNLSARERIESFPDLLERSVDRHLQSEVPVGVFLSGGLDSTSIVAVMSRIRDRIRTYTVGFSEESYSELETARAVSRHFGTEHHECILTPAIARDLIPEVINILDEPHGDWTHIASYHLSRLSKEDVTVVLCGAGGDELFGGYPTYTAARLASLYRSLPSSLRRKVIAPLVRSLPTSYRRMSLDFKAKSFVAGADLPPEKAHLHFKEVFDSASRRRLFTEEVRELIGETDPFSVFRQYLDLTAEPETINRLMYLDLKVFLPDCTLYTMDMVTSANSQECRAPFLDVEILDFAARTPWKWKVHGFKTKYLIRRAMEPYLPSECVRMQKKGFLIPGGPWLRGQLFSFAAELISDASRLRHIFNVAEMERILTEHKEGRVDNTRRLTSLLSFLLWAD